ncbi:MAG TPA: hypothetical protein VNA88_03120 [Candidatus Kapabacteria bacterium]|nr:hypothetical protein [Candidatus Kapabacteria bacterium]
MLVRYLAPLFALLMAAPSALAQSEANVWYFGRGAGIDFNGAVPTPLADGAIDQEEGCASIADPTTGQLLFYTDGMTVWNRQHRAMPNGTGLMGHASSTQSALIVPAPCDPRRFYVFTVDASPLQDPPNEGLHYSIVDLDGDGGLGVVTAKNVPIYAPTTEKLTAVRHANGIDVWVVTHEWSSNAFRAYLVSAAGVASTPNLSYTGSAHEGGAQYAIGYLKASSDGRRIASVVATSFVELFDFNAATGLLTYTTRLSDRAKYGLSFSPDGRFLYLVEWQPGWIYDSLFQYDVTAGDAQAIFDSRTPIATGDFYAMQCAPDGRIYIANNSALLAANTGWMPTIDRPNDKGIACGFNPRGFRMQVGAVEPRVAVGLPNMIESYRDGLIRPCGPPEALISLDDPICAGECTTIRDSSRNLPTEWQWTFEGGRPATSSERDPGPVCFDSAGVFTVRLVATNAKGTSEITRTITVRAAAAIDAGAAEIVASPGDTVAVPVTIGTMESAVPVGAITVRLGYDRAIMRPIDVVTGGSLVDGWGVALVDDTATSTAIATVTPPPGVALGGAGRILSIRFATWLTSTTTATLPLALEVPGTLCSVVPGRAGRLTLQICGLQARLIELDTARPVLRPNRPNPFAAGTRIAFATPRDGHVRLAVLDAAGTVVATLVDGWLSAGDHEIDFTAAGLASGIYHCQLRLGADVLLRRMALVR